MVEIKDTIASLRRGRGIKVCPKCGSTDISPITMTGYITQPTYVCNKCGFQSTIFPEVEASDLKGAREERRGR
ncbi:MAG: hypothetical protein WHS82_06520 [Candidatus Methanosuratincola sp.]